MDFEKGETVEERIENAFVMFYFNLMCGDYSIEYCEREIIKQEGLEAVSYTHLTLPTNREV